MIEVDLHLHTTFSDGTLTPSEMVRLCSSRGLKIISITDHDSTEGIPDALRAAQAFPELTVIPGIELSTDIPGAEIHILGYYVDCNDSGFQQVIHGFREGRRERARDIVKRLAELSVHVSWERVQELSDGGAVGRPHIAQAMVESGYVKYPKEAFDVYLGRNGTAYVGRPKLRPKDAVELLVRSGALPVMAHPTYAVPSGVDDPITSLRETLQELQVSGLVGIEVYYRDYTQEQIAELVVLADQLGVISCGGSDYHASGNPDEPEPGDVGPPMATVEALTELLSIQSFEENSFHSPTSDL